MRDKIKKFIDTLKPAINSDGGDLEFISYQDKVVKIRLLGACVGCRLAGTTLNGYIREEILNHFPEVNDVVIG